jgi:hypothetical protein
MTHSKLFGIMHFKRYKKIIILLFSTYIARDWQPDYLIGLLPNPMSMCLLPIGQINMNQPCTNQYVIRFIAN